MNGKIDKPDKPSSSKGHNSFASSEEPNAPGLGGSGYDQDNFQYSYYPPFPQPIQTNFTLGMPIGSQPAAFNNSNLQLLQGNGNGNRLPAYGNGTSKGSKNASNDQDSQQDDGEFDDDDKPGGKKRRTNYRRPENAAKLNAAVNALIMQKQDPNAPKDIRSVSKIFNIPYNTLRDNYLR